MLSPSDLLVQDQRRRELIARVARDRLAEGARVASARPPIAGALRGGWWRGPDPRGRLALPALLLAILCWGSSAVVGKIALAEFPPLTLAWLRFAVALLVLLPLARWLGSRPAFGRLPALLGLTGFAVFFGLHNLGLSATSAVNAALILDGGIPALIALLGAVVLGERLGRWRWLGIVTALAGVVVVTLAGKDGGPRSLGHGDLLMLASALCWAVYVILGKAAFATRGALAMVTGSTIYGAAFLTPVALIEFATVGVRWPTGEGVLAVLFLGIGCSGLTFVLLGFALARMRASEVAAWETLTPLIGVATAALVLDEPLVAAQLAGAALVVAGIVVASGAVGVAARRLPRPSLGRPLVGAPGTAAERPGPVMVGD